MVFHIIIGCMLFHIIVVGAQLRLDDHIQDDFYEDPKDAFFRHLEGYSNSENDVLPPHVVQNENVDPSIGSLTKTSDRNKREVGDDALVKISDNEELTVSKCNATATTDTDNSEKDQKSQLHSDVNSPVQPISINDFIRFRRGIIDDVHISDEIKTDAGSDSEKSGKMLDQSVQSDTAREPRGATSEHWNRQPYPVDSNLSGPKDSYNDNMPSASEPRAPRVHFVTQKRMDKWTPSTPVEPPYKTEDRRRDVDRVSQMRKDLPVSRDYDLYPRGYQDPYYDQYDSYYDRRFNRFDDRFDPYNKYDYEFERPPNSNRRGRIIYYATLPEVVRTPPNVQLRYRYQFQDYYDDNYFPRNSPYRFQKPYSPIKKPYDRPNLSRDKPLYPLKTVTDINVRDTKKNPENKIYSEVDNGYDFKQQQNFRNSNDGSYGRRS